MPERGQAHDGGICGQCICAQWNHGLPAAHGHGPSGRSSPAAQALPAGRAAGRSLRGGGVSAGPGLSRRGTGQAGLRRTAVCNGIRRAGAASAADSAAVCGLLRHGRLCAGAGTADRRRTGGQRHFLHGRGCPYAASGRHSILCGSGGNLSGCGPPRCAPGADPGDGVPGRTGGTADGAAGQRQHIERPHHRRAGSGGSTRGAEPAASTPGTEYFDGGSTAKPCRLAGGAVPGGAVPPLYAAALSKRGRAGRTAAGGAVPVGGDRRNPVSGCAGSAGPGAAGKRVSGPLGRTGERRP